MICLSTCEKADYVNPLLQTVILWTAIQQTQKASCTSFVGNVPKGHVLKLSPAGRQWWKLQHLGLGRVLPALRVGPLKDSRDSAHSSFLSLPPSWHDVSFAPAHTCCHHEMPGHRPKSNQINQPCTGNSEMVSQSKTFFLIEWLFWYFLQQQKAD